jgi:hypothetical protein
MTIIVVSVLLLVVLPDPIIPRSPVKGPLPSIEGDLIWSSATWANGHAREWSDEYDPEDATYRHAGARPKFVKVDGKGSAFIGGDGGSRLYIYANNYNSVYEVTFVWNKAIDNLDMKSRSRHGEPDPPENRFGGYGCSLHSTFITANVEYWHDGEKHGEIFKNGGYEDIGDDKPLPKPLENGKEYTIRSIVRDVGNEVHLVRELDYGDGKGFVEIQHVIDKAPRPYMLDKAKFMQKSYFWLRYNDWDKDDSDFYEPPGPSKGMLIKNIVIRALP